MIDREHTLLVGSYTDPGRLGHLPPSAVPGAGISRVMLGRDGHLSMRDIAAAVNPAVITPGPNVGEFYAVSETADTPGTVTRFTSEPDGIRTNESVTLTGRSSCSFTIAPNGDAAVVTGYGDGVIDVVGIESDGRLGRVVQSVTQRWHRRPTNGGEMVEAADRVAHRQTGPHPHGSVFWRDVVLVSDLGDDSVHVYRWDAARRTLEFSSRVGVDVGTGPRQVDLRPDDPVCYISGELSNTVVTARLHDKAPWLSPIDYVITGADSDSTVAELCRSPDGRFVLVSNRGEDTISSFAVGTDGGLQLIDSAATGGRTPRHFAVTPCGSAVVVANQDSNELRVLRRDLRTGRLGAAGPPLHVPSPNFVSVFA